MLTLEERERRAYIEGRTEEAELLSLAMDAKTLGEVQEQLEEKTKELDDSEGAVSVLEGRVENLEKELEQSADRVEALENQIHEAGVDLV